MIMRAATCLILLAAGVTLQARSQAQDAPPTNVPRDYANACGTCHDRGGFGVRVLSDRRGEARSLIHRTHNLPDAAIRAIVRNGVGAMPAMSRLEVSDEELARIIAGLSAARQTGTDR